MALPVQSGPDGFVARTVVRLLMRPWTVSSVEDLSTHFRIIDFTGGGGWSPGSKIQIKLDGGLITRTYTPIQIDDDDGSTRIIAYCHGQGPGSDWIRRASPGQVRPVFGPRTSLDLTGLGDARVLFGDETSIGLAASLVQTRPPAGLRLIFEANDVSEMRLVLDHLGIGNATLVERRADGDHGKELCEALLGERITRTSYILTGSAPSIQLVSRTLKQEGVVTRLIRAKAYWAPGKTGLD